MEGWRKGDSGVGLATYVDNLFTGMLYSIQVFMHG